MLVDNHGKKQGAVPAVDISAAEHPADYKQRQSALTNIYVKRHSRKIVKCKEYCVGYQSEGHIPISSPLPIPPSPRPQLYDLYLHRVTDPARFQTQIWCWTKPSSPHLPECWQAVSPKHVRAIGNKIYRLRINPNMPTWVTDATIARKGDYTLD
ncbi:hypothetical protein HGRIS_001189 [Hohenbuehelia grisea]|uniref:Uncharacterized protein n=1 Tax=Hohenbuehelia grisea TaxID=104357 RepID=A0ABR3JPT6_9AGAR